MPAPRKFSDAQRQALWRLSDAGMTSAEVAKAAEEGATGLAPFTISPRTVRDILAKMSAEADRKLPATVLDLENQEKVERAPARAARIIETELDRLEAKQPKQGLTDKEVDRLPKLAAYSVKIARLLEERRRQQARRSSAGERAGSGEQPLTALERLALEQEQREKQLSHAHTRQDPAEVDTPEPPTPPAASRSAEGDAEMAEPADQPEPPTTVTIDFYGIAQRGGTSLTREARDEARRKARAALASTHR